MSETTDPRPQPPAFESHMRVVEIERKSFATIIEQMNVTMESLRGESESLNTIEALEAYKETLGEAGIFTKKAADIYGRVDAALKEAATTAQDQEQLLRVRSVIDQVQKDIAPLLTHINMLDDLNRKLALAQIKNSNN